MALALMTAVVITTLLWVILGDVGPPLLVTLTVLTVLLLIPLVFSRLVRSLELREDIHRGLHVGVFLFLALLIVSSGFYNNYGLLGGGWLNRLLGDQLSSATFLNQITSLLLVGVCWWLGLVLGDMRITTSNIFRLFYAELLILILPSIFFVADVSEQAVWLYYVFLFAALMALGLVRVEETARRSQDQGSPFTVYWLAQIALMALFIVSVVGLAHALKLGNGFGLIFALIAPIISVLIFPIVYAGAKLIVLSGFRFVAPVAVGEQPAEAGTGLQSNAVSEPSTFVSLCAGLLLLLLIFMVVRLMFFTARRWREMAEDFEREEPAAMPSLGDQISEVLEERLTRLGLNLPGMGRLRRRLAARSIRRIYAAVSALAAERGYPRPAARTPYEHLGVLRQAFPDHEAQVLMITEAYVNVHYGEVPETPEALAEIRAAWQELRASAQVATSASDSLASEAQERGRA